MPMGAVLKFKGRLKVHGQGPTCGSVRAPAADRCLALRPFPRQCSATDWPALLLLLLPNYLE